MVRGAWRATVRGAAESWTWLRDQAGARPSAFVYCFTFPSKQVCEVAFSINMVLQIRKGDIRVESLCPGHTAYSSGSDGPCLLTDPILIPQ